MIEKTTGHYRGMSSRIKVPLLALLAICGLSSCHLTAQKNSNQKPPARMNVLFIALDDMNDWIQLLDSNAPIKTPNLKRLAQKGMLFTQAYCASPSCNPSRTTVLTGKMPSSTGVYNNATDWKGAMPDAVTLPGYFMANDYHVEGAGKIFHHHMNGAFHDTASFHEFLQMPWPPDAPMPKPKLNGLKWYGSANTDWGGWPGKDSLHVDARTVNYITGKLAGAYKQPFFLAAGIFRPHMPFFVPEEYFRRYPAGQVQMPEVRADDLEDIPSGGMKLWEETRWFFDGMMKAEKQHWEKFTLWEKTTHVPFIVVAPGITRPGSRCVTPVSLVDIYPTLIELCGLDPRPELDGNSLLPLLKDPEAVWDRPALMTYGRGNHALRSGKWRYIRYADGTEELYDQEKDPHDYLNVAGDPENAEVIEALKKWLPQKEAPAWADMKNQKQWNNEQI